jgi:transcriptional regulator with PAS, ATPase and Fis domain
MPTVRSWALKGFNAKNPVVEMLLILTECLKTIREGSQAPFTPQKNKPRSKSGKPQDPMKRVIDEDEIEPAMNILNAFLKAYKTKNNVAKTINVKPSTVRGWYEKGGSMSRGSFAFISKFYEENINTKKRRQA